MGMLTVTVLASPFVWLLFVWSVNRYSINEPRSIRWVVFGLTAASPFLALLAYFTVEAVRLGIVFDAKSMVILLEIGVPASLVSTIFAYWGSRGWNARRRV